jgi:RsiW-degrading membrane proteinase PrsW (M82 family)
MNDSELERTLAEIRSLRQQGVLTAQEAYERHMAALGRQPAVATAPVVLVAPALGALSVAVEREAAGPSTQYHALAIGLAVAGGVLGLIGAFFQELLHGGALVVFIGAPMIEEALKPAGIYILLAKWPRALAGRMHIALLTALSGLSFGVVESLVYVTLYFPEGGSDFVLFRFTVPLVLHSSASFIMGLGLSRGVIDWASGAGRLPKATRNCYVIAALVHAAYNITAVALELTGVLDFDQG